MASERGCVSCRCQWFAGLPELYPPLSVPPKRSPCRVAAGTPRSGGVRGCARRPLPPERVVESAWQQPCRAIPLSQTLLPRYPSGGAPPGARSSDFLSSLAERCRRSISYSRRFGSPDPLGSLQPPTSGTSHAYQWCATTIHSDSPNSLEAKRQSLLAHAHPIRFLPRIRRVAVAPHRLTEFSLQLLFADALDVPFSKNRRFCMLVQEIIKKLQSTFIDFFSLKNFHHFSNF